MASGQLSTNPTGAKPLAINGVVFKRAAKGHRRVRRRPTVESNQRCEAQKPPRSRQRAAVSVGWGQSFGRAITGENSLESVNRTEWKRFGQPTSSVEPNRRFQTAISRGGGRRAVKLHQALLPAAAGSIRLLTVQGYLVRLGVLSKFRSPFDLPPSTSPSYISSEAGCCESARAAVECGNGPSPPAAPRMGPQQRPAASPPHRGVCAAGGRGVGHVAAAAGGEGKGLGGSPPGA
jgi:hypothetical protein